MKKILIFMLSFVLWSNFAFAKSYYGHGDLKLSEGLIDYYIQYLKNSRDRSPLAFLVAPIGDGRNYATYYYCPAGQANCTSLNRKKATNACADSARKKYNDQNIQCFIFDFRRIVKWDNGINPGKGKTSKINSKWSKEEIIAKLTELGFYGETSSSLSKTTTEKEETKKKKKKKKKK